MRKRFILGTSKITKVMVKESCVWPVGIGTREALIMTGMKVSALTIVLMVDKEKVYMLRAKCREREKLHILTAVFR